MIDLYCIKPLDVAALAENVNATGGRLVTVEDHYPEGGIGETVLSALAEAGVALSAVRRLDVDRVPHSGKPEELLDIFNISGEAYRRGRQEQLRQKSEPTAIPVMRPCSRGCAMGSRMKPTSASTASGVTAL